MKTRLMLVAAVLSVGTAAAQGVGRWETSPDGLPYIVYEGALPFAAAEPDGTDARLPDDPYWLIGNHRLNLITHVSGIYQITNGERAWARFNADPSRMDYGVNDAAVTVDGKRYPLVGLESVATDRSRCTMASGVGFSRYTYALDGLQVTRTLSVHPEGAGAFLVSIRLRNTGRRSRLVTYEEGVTPEFVQFSQQETPASERVLRYPVHYEAFPGGVKAVFGVEAQRFFPLPPADVRCPYDVAPLPVFLCAEEGVRDDALQMRTALRLRPGEERELRLVIGLDDPSCASELLAAAGDDRFGAFPAAWKRVLPDLSAETDPVLRREMLWNAHFTEAGAMWSRYFGETFIAQGSVYTYHYGQNAANRDHLQAALPLCYTHPALAKSVLRYVMQHVMDDGRMTRDDIGFGYTPAPIFKESDQQIYLFWVVSEYLRITGDYRLLDETVRLYPVESGEEVRVLDLLERCFIYLRDETGRGRHGLVKLQNSDWCDGFFFNYPSNTFGGQSESHMNSAMVPALFPAFIAQLERSSRASGAFLDALRTYCDEVQAAFLADLGDRPFAARAYLGTQYRFGIDYVCLEPQGFLLMNPALSPERKRAVYEEVMERVGDPHGVRLRERPIWGDIPHGEDGGIWFSIEYSFLAGVAGFDKDAAWDLLRRMTFDNFTRHFPRYWVGQWMAPDEIEGTLWRPGLYDFWMVSDNYHHVLQGLCSHPHCWPLYCYFLLKDVQ